MLEEEFYDGMSTHLIKTEERLVQLNNLAKSGGLGLNDMDKVHDLLHKQGFGFSDGLQYMIEMLE